MRGLVTAVALAALMGPAQAQEAGLTGTWVATAAERDGAPAPDLLGHVLTFDDGFAILGPDGAMLYAGDYATDPAATPPAIDFNNVSGLAAGQVWRVIYRLEGDTLTTVDDAPDPEKGRPTEFAAPAGSGLVLLTFERKAGA